MKVLTLLLATLFLLGSPPLARGADPSWETSMGKGLTAMAAGRLNDAEIHFNRALNESEAMGRPTLRLTLSLLRLGDLSVKRGDFDQAKKLLERATEVQRRAPGAHGLLLVPRLERLAELERRRNKKAAAETLLKEALFTTEKSLGPNHPGLVPRLDRLAWLLRERNKADEALPLMERALQLQEGSLGEGRDLLTDRLLDLAKLNQRLKRYVDAETYYQQAFSILESAPPKSPDLLFLTLEQIALIQEKRNRLTKAGATREKLLALLEERKGPIHPDLEPTLERLAEIARITNKAAKRERFLRHWLKVAQSASESTPNPDPAKILRLLFLLSDNLEAQKKKRHAIQTTKRIAAILPSLSGLNRETALVRLAETQIRLGLLFDAEGRLRDALALRVERLGRNHPQATKIRKRRQGLVTQLEQRKAAEAAVLEGEKKKRRRASNQELVKEAQRRLNAMGFNAGVVDGKAGRGTLNAIDDFYRSLGLPGRKGRRLTSKRLKTLLNQLPPLKVAPGRSSQPGKKAAAGKPPAMGDGGQ